MRWWFYHIVQEAGILLFYIIQMINRISRGRIFFRVAILGRENLAGLAGPLIVTPTHKSYIDHAVIVASMIAADRNCRKFMPMRPLVADWLFQVRILGIPVLRLFWKLVGAHPSRRGSGMEKSLGDSLQDLQDGKVVVIYPEGAIKFRPGVHEARNGAAYLAMRSWAPILPVAIRGIEYLSPRAFLSGRRTFTVVFGEPYTIPENRALPEVTAIIRKKIEELYEGKKTAA